ncbi:metallophosphoesterase [Candidatus Lokiarchaeum ossiferum]|uniref:metallophosphoesterase n=1 Tax=Candidatus Lokiarchaeum ossiferum TaxID=2951803 RepID=UPI00352F9F1B
MNNSPRYAILSDIHGNRWALEAVLEDLQKRHISQIINLGDSIYGPLDPLGTIKLILKWDMISIAGNQDRILFENQYSDNLNVRIIRSKISDIHLDYLKSLPATLHYNGLFLCHGIPKSDNEYLFEHILPDTVEIRSSNELQNIIQEISAKCVCCGHSHLHRDVRLSDGTLILNPGSVGLPAYDDDMPYYHKMETKSPDAHYSVLYQENGIWQVEHHQVSYPWKKAVLMAEKNDRPDWARWLATGMA